MVDDLCPRKEKKGKMENEKRKMKKSRRICWWQTQNDVSLRGVEN